MATYIQPKGAPISSNSQTLDRALLRPRCDRKGKFANVVIRDVPDVLVVNLDCEGSGIRNVLDLPKLVPHGRECIHLHRRSTNDMRSNQD